MQQEFGCRYPTRRKFDGNCAAGLSILPDNDNRILDGRFITFTDIKRDIPVARMRGSDDDREAPVKPAPVGERSTAFEAFELAIRGDHDVALSVGINPNGVSVI